MVSITFILEDKEFTKIFLHMDVINKHAKKDNRINKGKHKWKREKRSQAIFEQLPKASQALDFNVGQNFTIDTSTIFCFINWDSLHTMQNSH